MAMAGEIKSRKGKNIGGGMESLLWNDNLRR